MDEAVDDPPYPVTHSETSVYYGFIKLPGLGEFLLPLRADFIIARVKTIYKYCRNQSYFKSYRKYETDVKIVPLEQ